MTNIIIQRPTQPWGYVVERGSKTYPGPLYRRRFEVSEPPEFDADAFAYITAVETADGQGLEAGVRTAINAFVVGCKADGIWNAIKASCIMAGARTLNGALVPLVGTAPTRFGTEAGWNYNRKTGVLGNGTNNYVNSNRNNNADPQNSVHQAVYATQAATDAGEIKAFIGVGITSAGATHIAVSQSLGVFVRSRTGSLSFDNVSGAFLSTGLIGQSRATSSQYILRLNGSNNLYQRTSETPFNGSVPVFARSNDSGIASNFSDARLAFYSIGEALDLALLDARVTTLVGAFAAAIP